LSLVCFSETEALREVPVEVEEEEAPRDMVAAIAGC
jgi:hypothetical protein